MRIFAIVLLFFVGGAHAADIKLAKTWSGDAYGYVPQPRPGPLALFFTTGIKESLTGAFTTVSEDLRKAGYVIASMDVPCHGRDTPKPFSRGEVRFRDAIGLNSETPVLLDCWAARSVGYDMFSGYIKAVSRVITDIQRKKIAAPGRVIVVGVSRGGYIALRLAADPRITDIVALAPVTNLQTLEEFSKYQVDQSVYGLDGLATALTTKRTFFQIGSNDDRVGTLDVLRLVTEIKHRAAANPVDMTLIMTPVDGHRSSEHERAARWVLGNASASGQQMAAPK